MEDNFAEILTKFLKYGITISGKLLKILSKILGNSDFLEGALEKL